MFAGIEPHGVRWTDGSFEPVDVILWATGFRPAVSHLAPLHLKSRYGGIRLLTMVAYVVRRLVYALITFFGITVATFALIHSVPGDPVSFFAGSAGIHASRPRRDHSCRGLRFDPHVNRADRYRENFFDPFFDR